MGGPMIKAFVQLGLAGLIFVAATVAAEAETIVCPLTQATRTITNAPGGAWWTTPIVNSLTNTQIVNIGGQRALQCVYGGAGAIQRYAPAGTVCVAIAGGFQCNPIVPVTHSTGTADVLPSFQLDLDNGAIAVAGTDADLWLQIVNFFEVYLTPVNGRAIWHRRSVQSRIRRLSVGNDVKRSGTNRRRTGRLLHLRPHRRGPDQPIPDQRLRALLAGVVGRLYHVAVGPAYQPDRLAEDHAGWSHPRQSIGEVHGRFRFAARVCWKQRSCCFPPSQPAPA